MDFSEALIQLKQGKIVSREGWNAQGQWIKVQFPDENSKMKKPYIFISPVDEELVPWIASQTDLLAEDWKVIM